MERLPSLPSRHGSAPAEVWAGPVLDLIVPTVVGAGITRAWMVTDAGVRLTRWPDRLKDALETAGIRCGIFDDVWPDPSDADAGRCLEAARGFKPDGFVAVGGGSSIDTAKGAALLQAHPGDLERWRGFHTPAGTIAPLVAVPTTSGTGSEVQSFGVFTRGADRVKLAVGMPGLMPRAAVLDAALTASVPTQTRLHAGLDAVGHALETLVSREGTGASRAHAAEALRLLVTHLPNSLDTPEDTAARTGVHRASTMAGQAIEAGMLGGAHATANPLSARFHVPHGAAVGTMLPHVVQVNRAHPMSAARYAEAADGAGLAGVDGLLGFLDGLLARVDRGRGLATWGVKPTDLDALARDAHTQWTGRFNPVPLDVAGLRALYDAAWTDGLLGGEGEA